VAVTAAAAVAVIVSSILVVLLTGMRPAYDAYGWLVWGHQALHLNLNTDGAPSWKPLTFLFTLPYALAGRAAMWLWMVTAVAGSLSGSVFAAHIAYRLTGASPGRWYAPVAAAAFAGLGVLGIIGYWHQVLISNSDPMVVSICLAAIDAHLARRPRLAFVLLVLASLGRPEAWALTGLYALWAWRAVPPMRALIAVGLLIIPVLWFGVPALASKSWMSAGNLDLNSVNALHGDKFFGVLGRFAGGYELPMQLAVVFALVLALALRDRAMLVLAAAALVWVAVEIVFAFHGFSAVSRYLMEPAAVMIVLAGAGVGRVLAAAPRLSLVLRWAGPAAVVVLVAALIPAARARTQFIRGDIADAHRFAAQDDGLQAVITRDGGARRIRACGQPVTDVGHQSVLAWDLGMNVGNVGFKPGRSINRGAPIVFFKPHLHGWQVLPIHSLAANRATCERLRTDTGV
jgi:hypothetical protein